MPEIENNFVDTSPFSSGTASAATAIATTVGYQVLSLLKVGRDVLSASLLPAASENDSNQDSSSESETRKIEGRRLQKLKSLTTPIQKSNLEELPIYTLHDISFHDTPQDCWMAIYDLIYDVTDFLYEHPGGDEIMMEYAGRDATLAFRSVGHSKVAEMALKPYLVGRLPENERIWMRLFKVED